MLEMLKKELEKEFMFGLDIQLFAEGENDDEEDDDEEEGDDGGDGNTTKEDDDKGGDDKGNKGKNDKGKNKAKTFTQEEVNRMLAKEKRQGRRSAFKELGVDPRNKRQMAAFKAFVNQKGSDSDDGEEDERITQAEIRAARAEAKAEALALGANSKYVDDIVTLIEAKAEDGDDISDLIGEVKAKYPSWFAKESSKENDDDDDEDDDESKENNKGKKGTGSSVNSKRKKGKDNGIGSRLATARVNSMKKKSGSMFGSKK